MPEFSVIIPCRDAAATLPSALASLRAQTWQDWEAICVDDGSCDDTAEVIDRVARPASLRLCPPCSRRPPHRTRPSPSA